MDRLTEAREKAVQRAETVRAKIGSSGSSGGRLLMGGGGTKGGSIMERVQGIRANVMARAKGMRETRAAGRSGPLDIMGGERKVESIDLPPSATTRKVISV